MDIWPIDFDKTIQEISEWHNQWKVERFGSDSLSPERYYNDDGRYLHGVREGESLNEEKATCDKVLELLVRIKNINYRLKGKGLSQHLQWKEREQLKGERARLYKEFLDEVQIEPEQAVPQPQQHTILNFFPKGLLNDSAKRILLNAANDGAIDVIGGKLKFQGSNALLAYMLGIAFCDDTKQYDVFLQGYKVKRGSTFFPDKLLSDLFGVKNLGQSRLQLDSVPKGYERVEKWLV